jgi:tRNA-specific 2-thiouridylase
MRKKVVVAMSGGVDSTTAAALLQKSGYEVSGITLRLHDCGGDDAAAAADAAGSLGIPHDVLDLRGRFRTAVMDRFLSEYAAGRTPNPCIDCNREIKFGALMEYVLEHGADALATGHYARVGQDPETGRWLLLRGVDRSKDQSYVLYQLSQTQLAHLLLPVGEYGKPAVRAMAADLGLCNADRPDSQDICFIPDGDYMRFLEQYGLKPTPGKFVDEQGLMLGQHQGMERYTIGQRKGLGISGGRPLYVIHKDLRSGNVVLGPNSHLYSRELLAARVNWLSMAEPAKPVRITARTRYSQREDLAVAEALPGNRVRVTFDDPQRAITAGQAVVFYDGERVAGGGTIEKTAP